jgi:hypothetical protein
MMYVICDSDFKIVHFEGIRVFGVKVSMLACFTSEKDALEVLFNMEDGNVIQGHTVRQVDTLTGTV